jgi:hypothetical protein
MKRLVTTSILLLGRYAMLPVVAVALAMVVAWLIALDQYPSVALATSPVVLSVAPAAIALAVGLLVLPGHRHAAPAVDEQSAPGLWTMWNEFDRTSPRSSRRLLIDAELNASSMSIGVRVRRRIGIRFWAHCAACCPVNRAGRRSATGDRFVARALCAYNTVER